MNTKINSILFLLLMLAAVGCKEEPPVVPPPPPPPVYKDTITVAVEDITHRSITVNIKTTSNNPKSTIKFFRIFNSTETQVSEYNITVNDTSIIDDGLQINTTYSYYAVRIDTTGIRKDSSNLVEANTLDTTNQNYIWQEFIIGEMGSQLIDIWGTDENNVYACGSVTINDTVYGILKWNGSEWLPEKKVGGFSTIFGFSNSDIWAVGGAVWHYDGTEWEEYTFRDPVITNNISYSSIWGTSSNNLYFGNIGGKIIHWNGHSATVFANLSAQRISDVYGLSRDFILASTSALAPPGEVFLYNGLTWNRFDELSINELYKSVYPITKKEFYVTGEDILLNRNGSWTIPYNLNVLMECIRGNKNTGDIAAVGHFATILHYNGSSWKEFKFSVTEYSPLTGVFITGNKIFAVGSYNSNQARIIIGTRN
jgi:hypothetical protein